MGKYNIVVMIYYLVANATLCSSALSYLFFNVHEPDCIVHFNTHVNLKILKHIRCNHAVFLHDTGTILWGYERFLRNAHHLTRVYLEEKSQSNGYNLDSFIEKTTFIKNIEPPIDYKTSCCSAGFKMLTYLLSTKKSEDQIRLIGYTFEGWRGHDWKYEKEFSKPYLCLSFSSQTTKTIRMSDANVFFLTNKEETSRKVHMYEMFDDFRLFEINYNVPFRSVSKYQSGALGFLRMIELGISLQDRNQCFQPFVLLEDDVSKSAHFRNEVAYPNDCDLLYIGVSSCFSKQASSLCKIDENLYKVVGMLSTHGIVVCSAQGANVLSRCLMEAFFRNKPYDIHISSLQACINVYALNKPIVYQDKEENGHEEQTNIVLDDIAKTFQSNSHASTTNQTVVSLCE